MVKAISHQLFIIVMILSICGCEKDIRNIALTDEEIAPSYDDKVEPVDINTDGFDFLEKMQGHWVGTNLVMADNFDFFSFDYRPISPSHIHGIFEGGTMGNLYTSFFISDFKGKRTLMARNGGLLNGIYRTSYFVLDKVEGLNDGSKFYRFVDAYGGQKTMFMELRFKQDSLYFNAYTSRLGQDIPSRHMTFKAQKTNLDLAQTAAATVNYPQNIIAFDFSNGFDTTVLQAATGAKSATFLAQDISGTPDLLRLATESQDPYTIIDYPHLSYLNLNISRDSVTANKKLIISLSKEPLTNTQGYFTSNLTAFNSILLFSELSNNETTFSYTYLHPGNYYINVTADMDNDGSLSSGDITHPLRLVSISPETQSSINITQLNIIN